LRTLSTSLGRKKKKKAFKMCFAEGERAKKKKDFVFESKGGTRRPRDQLEREARKGDAGMKGEVGRGGEGHPLV